MEGRGGLPPQNQPAGQAACFFFKLISSFAGSQASDYTPQWVGRPTFSSCWEIQIKGQKIVAVLGLWQEFSARLSLQQNSTLQALHCCKLSSLGTSAQLVEELWSQLGI